MMVGQNRRRALGVAAVAALALLNGRAIAADKPLVTFDAATLKAVTADAGRATRSADGGLRIAGGPDQTTVVSIPAAGGNWDLSAFEAITLSLKNPSKSPITVYARAENPDAAKLMNGSQNAIELDAGESKSLVVRLTRRPEDPTYKAFSQYYMYFKGMNVRDNTVDPSQIAKLKITIDHWKPGQAVEVTGIAATGSGRPLPTPFFPFIDQYGQYTHGDWPGKIYADADFAERVKAEAKERAQWPGPGDRTEYGGWAKGPKLKATGFFYAAKHDGKWWLVDPTGHLYWAYGPTGVGFGGDTTPVSERENWFVSLPDEKGDLGQFYKNGRGAMYMFYAKKEWRGFDIQRANLFRKYGPDYTKKVAELSHERLKSWGFNCMGNWSAPEIYKLHKTPYTVAINSPGMSTMKGGDGHSLQEVFDPAWETGLYRAMERERNTTANDPWNLGYFVDNERSFGWRPRAASVGEVVLKTGPKQPSKLKFLELLKTKYSTIEKLNESWKASYDSWDALLASQTPPALKDNANLTTDCGDFGMLYCERYFTVSRAAVKSVAPNNMFLGSRFYGHTDPAVVALAGKSWDVISYNIYDNPPTGRVNQLNQLDLPVMSTEWGVESDILQTPFRDAKLTTVLPRERAQKIVGYVEAALRHPNMVGAHFFQFRDQPLSGRPDGEATLRGFVNVADTPNFELIQNNRRLGYGMYEFRANAK